MAYTQALVLVCGQAPNLLDPTLFADPLFAVSGASISSMTYLRVTDCHIVACALKQPLVRAGLCNILCTVLFAINRPFHPLW